MSSTGTLSIKPPIHRIPPETAAADDFCLPKDWFRTEVTVMAAKIPPTKAGLLMGATVLRRTIMDLPHIRRVVHCEDGDRLILLRVMDEAAIHPEAAAFLRQENAQLVPYALNLDYDYWSVDEIFQAIFPESLLEGAPAGFATVGHIAHLNLNDEYLPYKRIIGQVILDKSPTLKTVVNKLDNIDNQFRVFEMEVLAGEKNFLVEQSESNCSFRFDFSQVYWNSRLHTEHARLVDTFQPEDVVADVFAGVGPFAVPAAKRGVGVLANDLNPRSYMFMLENIQDNKVSGLVRAFNEDGREFIRQAARRVLEDPLPPYKPHISLRERRAQSQRHSQQRKARSPSPTRPPRNRVDHFVMNLPDTAIEFLDAFRGILSAERVGGRDLKGIYDEGRMPMVHCYCFTRELEFESAEADILARVEKAMGAPLEGKVGLHAVRRVAPKKDMYCISFRLPTGVAFASEVKR